MDTFTNESTDFLFAFNIINLCSVSGWGMLDTQSIMLPLAYTLKAGGKIVP